MNISELKSKFDVYAFSGNRGWGDLNTVRLFDATDMGAIGFGGENVVRIYIATRGCYAASAVQGTPDWFDQNTPNSVYLYGTENYDGLRRVYNLTANRLLSIYAPYVAETIPSSATVRCGYKAEVPCEFGGFSVIGTGLGTLGMWRSSAVEIVIRSVRGAAFDNKIFSRSMQFRNKIEHMYKTPIHLAPGDRLDLQMGSSGSNQTKLYIRKL